MMGGLVQTRTASRAISPAPFVGAAFLGAALIFLVQPMFARMATPLLGGAPSVWNVSLVCFQAALLGGYAYAHLLARLRSIRLQVMIHAMVVLVGLLCLPLQLSGMLGAPDPARPALWLIGEFTLSIALPFAALSATAPLSQHWYARSGLADAADPYHLYAASNLGSLIGLAAYPLLIEPFSPLAAQSQMWSLGYVVLGLMLLAAGWSTTSRTAPQAAPAARTSAAPSQRERLIWLALSFAPSSLLVGATTHITTDVAAAPFLWAPPLIVYLLTFVIAFGRKPVISHAHAMTLAPIGAAFAALMLSLNWQGPILVPMLADLLALFLIALACHGALNLRRPDPAHLTQFYLIMSLGGVLGGAFNALAAPHLFDNVFEFPLMLVLSMALLGTGADAVPPLARRLILAAAICLAGTWAARMAGIVLPSWFGMLLVAPAFLAILVSRRAPFGAAMALALMIPTSWALDRASSMWTGRSFFGVVRVIEDPAAGVRMMLHGTTIHGAQSIRGDLLEPRMYYAPGSPIRQAFDLYGQDRRIGVTGLGVGAVACFAKPGQDWTFFEIDPLVVKVATDPSLFTYLQGCQPNARIILGDARVEMARLPDRSFDFMLLNAFSSDSIPTHLLTVEAMRMYLEKVSPEGVVALHISNRHLDLRHVAARVVAAAGAHAVIRVHHVSEQERAAGAVSSALVLVSRTPASLDRARSMGQWSELVADDHRPWTDDYSNIVGAMLDHQLGR
jgi:hypothetical protein